MDDLNALTSRLSVTIDPDGTDTFEQSLLGISEVVDQMLSDNPDLLFSYLYRLDVDEGKIKNAMSPLNPEAPHIGLARLIIERQLQRIRTRREYASNKKKG